MNLPAHRLAALSTLLGLSCAGSALAQQADAQYYPYYVGASERVTHDSYMPRYGGQGQDWISSTGLRVGIDRSFGRQQLVAKASVDRNIYKRNSFLNNNSHDVSAALNWSSAERLSGLVALQSSESLYRNTLNAQVNGRNLLRNQGATFRAQLGSATIWSFDAGYSISKQRVRGDQALTFNYLDTDQNTVDAGVRWAPTPDLYVRLGGRHGRGKLPASGDQFTRNDVDLSTGATLTGASDIFARLSSTRLKHTVPGFANSSGWTGLLGYNWRPTGKLRLTLTGSRDNSLGSVDQVGALNASTLGSLSNTVALSANWEITSQLLLDSRLSYMRRTLDRTTQSSSAASNSSGKDSIKTLSAGLRYLPLRNLELGCGFSIEDHPDQALPGYAAPYNARAVYCSAQAFLR